MTNRFKIGSIVLFLILPASFIHPRLAASIPESTTAPTLTLLWQTAFDKDSVLTEPDYIAVDSQGNSYIGELSPGIMKKFNTDGKFVTAIRADTQDLTGIGVDSQGNILLAGCERGHIQKFDGEGSSLGYFAADLSWCAIAIAVGSEDQVYALGGTKEAGVHIQKFDSTGGQPLVAFGNADSGDGEGQFGEGNNGMTLAIDQDDKLYATDPANNRILKFDEDGQFLTSFDLPDDGKPIDRKLVFFYDPWGVAVDGAGNIYVSNSYFLRKFDADGNILAEWSTSEGDLYRGGRVAVDVAGNIYIVAEGDVTTADNKPFKALVLKKFEQSAPE